MFPRMLGEFTCGVSLNLEADHRLVAVESCLDPFQVITGDNDLVSVGTGVGDDDEKLFFLFLFCILRRRLSRG